MFKSLTNAVVLNVGCVRILLGEGWNLNILQISYLDVTSENIQ